MLDKHNINMEPKSFAVGVRVEHPQTMINRDLYGEPENDRLGAASYKVTHTLENGRGVYSFCMCPGGYVVNASSEEDMLAVNGMSYQARDSHNANSAIIVTVNPSDFPEEGVLGGIALQRKLERRCLGSRKRKNPGTAFQRLLYTSEKYQAWRCDSLYQRSLYTYRCPQYFPERDRRFH